MNISSNNQIYKALKETRNNFPKLIKVLALSENEKSLKNTLNTKLISQMAPDFPSCLIY